MRTSLRAFGSPVAGFPLSGLAPYSGELGPGGACANTVNEKRKRQTNSGGKPLLLTCSFILGLTCCLKIEQVRKRGLHPLLLGLNLCRDLNFIATSSPILCRSW